MLKLLDMIFNIVVVAALGIGIFWFGAKAVRTFDQALEFRAMSAQDKAILWIIDRDSYNKLETSYEFVDGIFSEFGW